MNKLIIYDKDVENILTKMDISHFPLSVEKLAIGIVQLYRGKIYNGLLTEDSFKDVRSVLRDLELILDNLVVKNLIWFNRDAKLTRR